MPIDEPANTSFIDFDLNQSGLEPTIYRTRDEVGELVGATHGRRQIFKVAFQFVAVGTFYPIIFSLASLGERFVDGTSTYLVIFQIPRVSEYESAG